MDICTKVALRQRLLESGKITLYFDYYPPIRNPKTNKMQRHEYLGIYLYGNPTNKVQRDFNQAMLEKGELLRCRRQEQVRWRTENRIDFRLQYIGILADFLTAQSVILHIIVKLVMGQIVLSPHIRV